jgi:large subunit ribosomal protein L25
MPDITLVAETGRTTGSRPSNRLRREDRIPAIVYGNGVAPTPIVVERRDLRLALSTPAGMNAVISLSVDGRTHPVVVKEMQRHKVRRTVTHVDFFVVNLSERITVEVPVVLTGEAKAVTSAGYLVDPQINTVTVSCTPQNIPNELTIDVTDMKVGDTVTVADLALPAGVTSPLDPAIVVVATLATRAAIAQQGEESGAGAES